MRVITNTVPIIISVVAMHCAVIAYGWRSIAPQMDISGEQLTYVDFVSEPAMANYSAVSESVSTERTTESLSSQDVVKHQEPPSIQNQRTSPTEAPQRQQVDPVVSKNEAELKSPKSSNAGSSSESNAVNTANHNGRNASNSRPTGRGSSSATTGGGSGNEIVPATHIGGHLNNPPPPLPRLSLENGEQGSVGLRVQVSAEGRAMSVVVSKSSGFPRLDRAAKTAVEKYRFRPATRGGVPIPFSYDFSINFSFK